jgi:hypothetical protein
VEELRLATINPPSSPSLRVLPLIVNDNGDPRLCLVQDFFLPLTQDKIPDLVETFRYWRDYVEYLALHGENVETGEEVFCAVKCSKRGNDVYAKRLDLKLNFFNHLKNVKFFENIDFDKQPYAECNLLWVSLTWDSKLCSLHEAWENSYYELHKFKANLENKYGKVEWLMFPQPFPSSNGEAYGYPHYHGVLFFKESSFNAFPNLEKDKQGKTCLKYRVKEKREIEVQGKWQSFIDVQAMSSLKGAINYCKKYAQEVCYGDSDKAVLTSAVLWLYQKKGYSMTRTFQKALNDLIASMHPRKRFFQQNLDGSKAYSVWDWEFVGIRSFFDIREVLDGNVSSSDWVLSFSRDEWSKLVERKRGLSWMEKWEIS